MASVTNKDELGDDLSSEYEKQRLSFIADLKRFNENRGTPFERIPEICGQEVDLYHLYQRVTACGGWQKVNNEQRWEDFQEDFALPRACVNSTQALKNIYFRYLNLYEKVNFLGEDPDFKSNEEEDGPARKKICLPIETIPLNYNYNQHKLTDAQRQQHSLSTDIFVQSKYEKLELSLRSGLPNEVDLAINVCVLLSTEGKHCMKLENSPHILPLLLAHIGVFDEESDDLQDLHKRWMSCTKRNFLRFWFETVDGAEIKPLITWRGQPYRQRELVGSDVLNLGRDLGVLDVEGQRVLQIAVFLHNLSFEEANQKILARSYLVFKFLMLSMHSTFGGLRQLALDTLANLSCELALDTVTGISSQLMVDLLNGALFSEDRFFLVRGLEILGKISQLSCNESLLLEHLKEDVYKRLVALLTVQDIQLIVHTLEAIYKLSKVGEPFTTRLARVHKAIDTLVSLITIEAQSFGPGSLVGIKVVEYVPPAHVRAEEGDIVKRPTTVIQPINPDSVNIYQVPASLQGGVGSVPDTGGGSGQGGGGEGAKGAAPVKEKEPLTDIQATTSSWLNATFELKKKSKVNQVELFSDYLQFCRKFGINNAMSSAEFLHLVKVIFHQCEVVSINRKNGDRDVFLEGLCKRSVQKPFAVTTLPPEKVRNPLSVNVSPKQTPPQVVDPLAHTPTLRQRLMEPPRPSLHPPLLHAGATSSSSSPSVSSTPVQGATRNSGQQTSSATPASTVKVAASLHAKIVKGSKVPSIPSIVSKRVLPSGNVLGNANDNTNLAVNHQPSNHKTQPTALLSLSSSSGSNSSAAQSFPSITHALQSEQSNRGEPSDPMSVKSLLAKKLSQGVPDQDMFAPGPMSQTSGVLQPNPPQIPSSTANSIAPHSMPHMVVSSSNTAVPAGVSVANISSQAVLNQQNRPVPQNTSSVVSVPAATPSSTSSHVFLSSSSTPNSSDMSNPNHQNSINTAHAQGNAAGQLTISPSAIQNSLNNALAQQNSHQNSGNNGQQNNGLPTALQNSTLAFIQRNSSQASQSSPTIRSTIPPNNNISIVPQQHPVNVQIMQQSSSGTNMSRMPQQSGALMQPQNTSVPHNASDIPCAIMPKTTDAVQQQSNSVVLGAVTTQCSLASSSSQPVSIAVNHVIRNPSNMLIANHQAGSTPSSSNAMSLATAVQGTTVTQSISSPAVAALLTTNSQQGSQMIISSPMIAGQVQRPQAISGQAPSTVVIQTPPGTIVMPSRQVLVQGNGSAAFGSIQRGSQGGTVSFIVPSHYRQNSGVTVQGLNFIQQQGNVNVVPSLALANNTTQSQQQNLIQVAQTQQNLIQTPQNQSNLVQSCGTASITGHLGSRQIVLTPNQTTIPVGVQIASLPGGFVRNSSNICISPQQQQQNIVIQSTATASSGQSLAHSVQPQGTSVTMNVSHIHPSQTSVQIPVQSAESQQSRSASNQQQPQQQTVNQNVNTVSSVVTDTQLQQQQTAMPNQCNGMNHDVNGILGSPESVGSDLPPSPLSTGIASDLQNGKLLETDKSQVLKRNDFGKLVEKTVKINGYVHPPDSGNHDNSRTNVSEMLFSRTTGANSDSQGGVIVNGRVSGAVQPSNSLGHQVSIPVAQGVGNNTNNGTVLQVQQQGTQQLVIHQGNQQHIMSQGNQQLVLQHQGNQQHLVLQPGNQQQLILQQGNQPHVVQQQTAGSVLPQSGHQIISNVQHKPAGLVQEQVVHQPQQQQAQYQQVQPQQMQLQHSHVQIQQPQQHSQVMSQQQQPVAQQPQQLHSQVQVQPFPQQQQVQRQMQLGMVGNQQVSVVQQSQQSTGTTVPSGQMRPRISTLPCQPTAPGTQQSSASVHPTLNRDTSRDSDASNDSIASSTDAEKTTQMTSGQSFQNPVSPNSLKKKPKGKRLEVPPLPEKLPPRSRKKKGEEVTTVVQAGQGSKPIQINMEYMCEWANCRRCFSSARLVFLHVFKYHLPKSAESSCQWVSCEKLVRKRWSLVSHVQDHHCSEMAMRAACQRRYTASQQQASGAAAAPSPAPHQPMIYPPDAAMQAIRRFSIKHPYPEFAEQREGPVSKHIRLTAALILRNICHCSSVGRRLTRRHEQQLSYNTMNAAEASTALSHCLWEIIQCCEQKPSPLKL